MYVFEGKAACGRGVEPIDFAEHFGLDEFVARWSEWRCLPTSAQCTGCVDHLGTPDSLRRRAGFEGEKSSASISDVLSVSLFCAGLHGSLDAKLRALLDQHLAGDDSVASIALDRAITIRRCTCGAFEHEVQLAEHEARMTGHRADVFIVDDPDAPDLTG